MVVIFAYTSNQQKIKEVKNKIKGHLLEIRLFKNNLPTIIYAQLRILLYTLKYLRYSLKALLAMLLPFAIILIHLDGNLGYKPLKTGENSIVTAKIADGGIEALSRVAITPPAAIVITTPPLRIVQRQEVSWRIRAQTTGKFAIRLKVGDEQVTKQIIVADTIWSSVSLMRCQPVWYTNLWHPREKPLTSPIFQQISVNYPPRYYQFLWWQTHWLVVFFILSLIFGFIFKVILKIEI